MNVRLVTQSCPECTGAWSCLPGLASPQPIRGWVTQYMMSSPLQCRDQHFVHTRLRTRDSNGIYELILQTTLYNQLYLG